jgi:hypothetical protein
MSLPDSYTLKPGSIPAYFEAMLNAEAPKRFTADFWKVSNLQARLTDCSLAFCATLDLSIRRARLQNAITNF